MYLFYKIIVDFCSIERKIFWWH